MTDTDKLKRLADELKDVASGKNEHGYLFVSRSEAEAILALIAENEAKAEQFRLLDEEYQAMRAERDEAVAVLRKVAVSMDAEGGSELPEIAAIWDFLERTDESTRNIS